MGRCSVSSFEDGRRRLQRKFIFFQRQFPVWWIALSLGELEVLELHGDDEAVEVGGPESGGMAAVSSGRGHLHG